MKAINLSFVVLVAITGIAFAEKPWEKGVPVEKQKEAEKLFEDGNQAFAQQQHKTALDAYRKALALWDHPLVRFNTAVTLIRLDNNLEAAEHLEAALRFGAEPFKPELHQQALDFQKLLTSQLGFIEAKCDQAGANVLLDGKPWFACPGTQKVRTTVGQHALVGELKGYLTSSQRIIVDGGKTATETVKLVPLESAVILEYPYPRWIPATIGGIGFAVALGGLAFYAAGSSQMDQFESDFASQCPTGCEKDLTEPEHRPLAQVRDSARLKGTIGITMMIAGGVAFIGGVVGFLVDKPKRVLPNVEIAPTNGGGTASVGWTF